ncbi:response regulator transcription factor [Natronoflexus pectinivorans]|uniref:DNA-binding NarL/FixJ family response regulator n=1 Tax=Natronoflexus pectinivorans TaxID=682526 RepID=A0A4R2GN32_9BACT|nr:response regulator transcription factor [Natronoflexus pectinivorans]TCO10398.1 DNA-binding NarL/FixJ family response regulator [Natronoflexus pectinivorans]
MVKILIVEQSYLVRKGIIHILKQFPEIAKIEILGSHLGVEEVLEHFMPDILIINTSLASLIADEKVKGLLGDSSRVIYVIGTALPYESPENQFSVFDSKISITRKLAPYIKGAGKVKEPEESEELTPREKLILKNVALGRTNKEIATQLHISTHTVISHRKNITRKLDIKSVSGLTVYAIINGLIKMEDIS